MLINFSNECRLWKKCVPVFVETGEPELFWSFKHLLLSLLSPHGSFQPRSAPKGRVHHRKWAWVSACQPTIFVGSAGHERDWIGTSKVPRYPLSLRVSATEKTCSNCIINIIVVWEPIIRWLSFTCHNLESGSSWIFDTHYNTSQMAFSMESIQGVAQYLLNEC